MSFVKYTHTPAHAHTHTHTQDHTSSSTQMDIWVNSSHSPKHLSANLPTVFCLPFPDQILCEPTFVFICPCGCVCANNLTTTDKVAVILSSWANLPKTPHKPQVSEPACVSPSPASFSCQFAALSCLISLSTLPPHTHTVPPLFLIDSVSSFWPWSSFSVPLHAYVFKSTSYFDHARYPVGCAISRCVVWTTLAKFAILLPHILPTKHTF